MKDLPIHEGNIPDEFAENEHIVKCLNYPNSDDPSCSDFVHNNMDIFGFVQICSQTQEESDMDEIDGTINFPDLNSDINTQNLKSAYAKCIPHFKEAMDWIGSVGNTEDISKVCKFLNEITGEMKSRINVTNDSSKYVSSNIPCETMKNHHGANGRNSIKRKRF